MPAVFPFYFSLVPAKSATSQRFNVRDFGAKADGVTDDGHAIQAAIDEAIKTKEAAEVFLPKGKYRLGQRKIDMRPSGYAGSHINILRGHDLLVRGEQGTLLLSGEVTRDFFSLTLCDGVAVRDMEFDSDPLPYTQGTIEAVDVKSKSVVLRIDKGYDGFDREDFRGFPTFYELRIFDNPAYEGHRVCFFPHIKTRERIGPQLWRCQLKFGPEFQLTPQLVGKKWMHYGKGHYHSWAFRVDRSSSCIFENIKLYAVGEGGFSFWGNPGDLTVRNCYIGPPPGSGRLFTADGGTMMFYNRGTISVIGCDFSHTDDDCFNMGTQYSRISESQDAFTCGFKHWDQHLPPQVGDVFEVYDWQTSKRKARAKLVAAQPRQGGGYTIRLDREVNFNLGTPQALALGKETGADRVIDINSAGRAIIKNSRFSALRARCIMIKSPGSVIEGNTFSNTHMPGVCGGEKISAFEGPPARDLTIRNNLFKGIDAANIMFAGANNADVVIEGNTFVDCGRFPMDYANTRGIAIDIRNVSGARVENNIFGPSPQRPKGTPQVTIEDSDKVEIGQNQGLKEVVRRPLQGAIN
jgi:hypothetical protein